MKTKNDCLKSPGILILPGVALLISVLAAGTALAGPSDSITKRPDPFTKGATRLMERPTVEALPTELENAELAQLHTNWHRLQSELFRCPTVRSNNTIHIAVHRMNQNPGRPVMVMIHGVLSDHLTWEYVAPGLVTDYEIWLVDLPGCGDSDAPKPSAIEQDGYSPTGMGERVWQALQQVLATEPAMQQPRRIVLVGHSLGGTVVLRMMSAPQLRERYAGVIEHVEHLVLFAPSDLAINSVPASFRELLGLKGWMVGVGNALGVMDSKVRDLTKASYHRAECATREIQAHFGHVLGNAAHREAAQAMLREFVPFDSKTMRPIWTGIDPLVADYHNIRVPVLIAHGVWDETLSVSMAHKLKNQIPGAWLVEIPRSGHSLAGERPTECTELIRQFVTSDMVRLPAGLQMTVYPGSVPATGALVKIFPVGNSPKSDSLETRVEGRLP